MAVFLPCRISKGKDALSCMVSARDCVIIEAKF